MVYRLSFSRGRIDGQNYQPNYQPDNCNAFTPSAIALSCSRGAMPKLLTIAKHHIGGLRQPSKGKPSKGETMLTTNELQPMTEKLAYLSIGPLRVLVQVLKFSTSLFAAWIVSSPRYMGQGNNGYRRTDSPSRGENEQHHARARLTLRQEEGELSAAERYLTRKGILCFGIESVAVADRSIDYVNLGETYQLTIIQEGQEGQEGGEFSIASWGGWVEESEGEYCEENNEIC